MKTSPVLDYDLIAFNVRCIRMAHSQTQAELAVAASVDKATVYRLEAARPVHRRSLEKVCKALGEPTSFVNSVLSYGTPQAAREVFVHRQAEANWFPSDDRRKRIPEDSQARIQNEEERLRLGRAGVVASFQAYMFTMPRGPGMSRVEVYEKISIGPNGSYEECVAVCARGSILVRIGERAIELGEGDGVGYSADEEATAEPLSPINAKSLPPLLWFITANRRGAIPIEFNRHKRSRTRHPRKKTAKPREA